MLILTVVTSSALAMIVHELGHLIAARICKVSASELGLGMGPKLLGFRLAGILFTLRAIPIGSFVMLDGTALENRSLRQQLLIHLGGIIFNLVFGFAAYGTIFGWLNLLLAAGNLLPLFKHDGWRCGLAIMRTVLRRKSQPVEWIFTFSGGFVSLMIVGSILYVFP